MKILVIDDSSFDLACAKKIILDHIEGVDVDVIDNSEKGMQLMEVNDYHVVILNIVMPKISGFEVLSWIKEKKKFDLIKVLMMSSLEDLKAVSQCFDKGAYDFINKPLEKQTFIARINHAITEYRLSQNLRDNISDLEDHYQKVKEQNNTLKFTQSELIQSKHFASIGHLAAGMAHEINNPLGFMKSNLSVIERNLQSLINLYETAKKGISDPHKKKEIDQLESSEDYDYIIEDLEDIFEDTLSGTRRITSIIASLRRFSSVDNDDGENFIDISEVIETVLELINELTKDRVEISFTPVKVPLFVGKISIVHQSIYNVIMNGYEAIMKKGPLSAGEIRINITATEDELTLLIIDDGVGMSANDSEFALDPFYTTKEIGSGVGL